MSRCRPLSRPDRPGVLSKGSTAIRRAASATPLQGGRHEHQRPGPHLDSSFHAAIPEEQIADLRRRIARRAARRGAGHRSVAGRAAGDAQGARAYWETDYDWRKAEAKPNALPQFTTQIDGVDIHFIHVKSDHENALPLIMTHGWPGSVIELLETVGRSPIRPRMAEAPKTRSTSCCRPFPATASRRAHRGRLGPGPRAGVGGADAPPRLHPLRRPGRRRRCVHHRRDGPPGTRGPGRHAYELAGDWSGRRRPPLGHRGGKAAIAALATFRASGFGYFLEQATRPQTIGYALLDSPVALAAWMLDHDTDSYYKISHAFVDGEPSGNLTRDHILDTHLYWLLAPGPPRPARTGKADEPRPSRRARLLRRSRFRLASPRSRTRSSWPRAVGRAGIPQSHVLQRRQRGATSPPGRSGAVLERGPGCIRVAPVSLFSKRHIDEAGALPFEGQLAEFDGATGWLNSSPLSPADLRGQVVLVDFWTYTCINWLRTLGYVRAWAEKYEDLRFGRGRRPYPRVSVRTRHRQRPRGREGDESRVSDRTRQRLCGLAGLQQPLLAGLCTSPMRKDKFRSAPVRGGWLRRVRTHRPAVAAGGRSEGAFSDASCRSPTGGSSFRPNFANLETPESYLGYEQAQSFASPGGARRNDFAPTTRPNSYA